MIKVANKKVINRLAVKSFKASKTRNIFAIVAISLTTILFTSLFTIGIGMLESIQNETIRQSGGDGHAVLKYITDEEYNKIKNHPLISEISYNKIIADSVDNPEFLKRHVEMYYMDNTAMKLGFCEPTSGKSPIEEYEIIADTKTLDLLGVAHEVGAKVPLTYIIKGKQMKTDFILSGYWESDPIFNVGFAMVSRAFMDANSAELQYTYKKDLNMTGSINSYIMFKNSRDLEGKLNKIITDSGYTVHDETLNNDYLATDITSNVNWAYISSNFSSSDPGSLIAMLMAIVLIVFTGYLIIYNIFEISVIKDIRFYGLLKTIGTTPKQIKRIITRQAVILSIIGIPIGLMIGFFMGKEILPMIAASTNLGNSKVDVSLNPLIFIGASLFSIVTVFISTRRPGRIASKVSPVEAVRYNENCDKISKKTKKTTDGGKLWKMAFSNLIRNKKRTFIVIMSMTLSVVLLNSVFTISRGFDIDKYLSTFVDTDFLIGHANYFNLNHFRFAEDELNKSLIKAVQEQPGFEEGGKIYKTIGQCSVNYDVKYNDEGDPIDENGEHINLSQDDKPTLDLYGLDNLPLSRLNIVEGENSPEVLAEKMKTGKYIIEGLCADDHNVIYPSSSHYNIGDIITVNMDGKSYEYELLAKSRIKGYADTDRSYGNIIMYLPSQEYIRIDPKPIVMTYGFQVADDKEIYIEDFLKSYTSKVDSLMDYESKQKWVNEFQRFCNTVITVGGILSFMIGLIGILNFVNSVLTSILSRRQEFAILQSIGMTGKQLNKMLCFEGLYYAVSTIVVSFILSALFSVFIIGGVVGNLWFFSYKFVIKPLLITYPILIVLSSITPYIAYNCISRQSIVERLREIE